MFERFTERARQVVVLAQEEARTLRHNYIGSEHLLLGLVREEQGIAARVLESLGVSGEEALAGVVRIVGQGEGISTGQIPFTPRAKKILELSNREALSLGVNYIATEHVLLGLVRENEGVGSRVLLDLNVTSEQVRIAVKLMLAAPGMRGGDGPRSTTGYATSFSVEQVTFAVLADSELRKLLMAAAGRALADGRSEYGVTDVRAVSEGGGAEA